MLIIQGDLMKAKDKYLLLGMVIAVSVLAVVAIVTAQPFGRFNQNQNGYGYGFGMMNGRGGMGMMGARNGGMGGCPMMGFANQEVETISGTVAEIEWHEVVLSTAAGEAEIHMPPWFASDLGIKEGDSITAKGVYVKMHGDEFVPFEITVNGKTYGSVDEKTAVWMQ